MTEPVISPLATAPDIPESTNRDGIPAITAGGDITKGTMREGTIYLIKFTEIYFQIE